VKIEEQEPDVGRKINDSLVPIQLKTYPYPFVRIPQEYTSNKQLKNPNNSLVSSMLLHSQHKSLEYGMDGYPLI